MFDLFEFFFLNFRTKNIVIATQEKWMESNESCQKIEYKLHTAILTKLTKTPTAKLNLRFLFFKTLTLTKSLWSTLYYLQHYGFPLKSQRKAQHRGKSFFVIRQINIDRDRESYQKVSRIYLICWSSCQNKLTVWVER